VKKKKKTPTVFMFMFQALFAENIMLQQTGLALSSTKSVCDDITYKRTLFSEATKKHVKQGKCRH
jgi:hypothetical protein